MLPPTDRETTPRNHASSRSSDHALPLASGGGKLVPKVFISYRRADSKDITGRVFDHLAESFGEENVFRDVHSIAPGDEFAEVIRERLQDCVALIAIIGPEWIKVKDKQGKRRIDARGDYVKTEISTALKLDKRVIPVLVGGAALPKREQLPRSLRELMDRHALEITEQRFDYDLHRLIRAIDPTAATRLETQLVKELTAKQKTVREQLSIVNTEDKPRVAVLEKELADALRKSQNLEAALAERQGQLALATQNLDRFKHSVPGADLSQAKQALAQGDTTTADELLERAHAAGLEQTAEAAFQRGELAYARIDYARAHEHYADAARLRPENSHYLTKLGEILYELGRHSQALPWLQEALTIRKKVFGPTHLKVAESLNDVAGVLCAQGNYAEAEPLYQESLAIRKKLLGQAHPDVASALNNLGEKCREVGEWERAEPLYLEALAIYEKAHGREHRDVASVLNNLGMLYHAQGLLAKAEPLYEEALAIDTKVLPANHPDIATDYNSLGVLYFAQEQWRKAEKMHLQALEIRRQSLPALHPDTATSLYNVGRVYEAEGKLVKAEPLFRQALKIFQQSLPSDSPLLGKATEKHTEIVEKRDRQIHRENRKSGGNVASGKV